MEKVYIGLGSNLGDRRRNLKEAVDRIISEAGVRVTGVSSIYLTEPVGTDGGPWFCNAVIEAETSMEPLDLLLKLQRFENEMGRSDRGRNAPRPIDMDILLFGGKVISSPALVVPHPRMLERRFVLEPLVEVAAGLEHPVRGGRMSEWLAKISDEGIAVKKGKFYVV
jgi:2-amino-4-hydroxy-6-hydroxymethyldihydropteridine diphosphokinase